MASVGVGIGLGGVYGRLGDGEDGMGGVLVGAIFTLHSLLNVR